MKRIHVAGVSPRSGTTLLAEAMVACFDIDGFMPHEARIFTAPPDGVRTFLTKAPRDILLAEEALEQNPGLSVIGLLRDPRDIIVSRHRRNPARYWAGLKFWKTYTPVLRRLADHPRFLVVRYEDLIADPDAVQALLAERLPDLKQTRPFSRYHEVARPSGDALDALNGVRPITAASHGQWREHLPRIAGQMAIHGSIVDDLIEFGYETDDQWLTLLDGVTPDLTPSHWPEHFTRDGIARMLRAP